MARDKLAVALKLIFDGIDLLQKSFQGRHFTIDGRLVGDIGEVIAAAEFDLVLDEISRPVHDARSGRRNVQIKATFKSHLAVRSVPDYLIGLKLNRDGTHEVIFNGPGSLIAEHFGHRKDFGVKQIGLPIAKLRDLSVRIPRQNRIKALYA